MFFVEVENVLRQIALGGIGYQRRHALARAQTPGDVDRREYICARARSRQHTLNRCELFHHVERVAIADRDDLVGERQIACLGDEARSNTFHLMLARGTSAQHRTLGFDHDPQHAGIALLEIARHAGEGAAGAGADDNSVNLSAELVIEFAGRGLVVEVGVVRVFELACDEGVGGFGSARVHIIDRAHHSFRMWSANHFSTQRLHQGDLFNREALGHRKDRLIAAARPNERESDTGVSGSGFKNRCTGLQPAVPFRLHDHAQRGAVFDAAAWIQVFELGIDIGDIGWNDLAKMEDWGFADQFGNVLGDPGPPTRAAFARVGVVEPEGSHFSSFHEHLEGVNVQGYAKRNRPVNVKPASCLTATSTCFSPNQELTTDSLPLVERPSLPPNVWHLVVFVAEARLLAGRLLLTGGECPLLAAPNLLMRVQPFEDKFRSRHQLLRRFFAAQSQRAQFVEQALNAAQLMQHLLCAGRIAHLDFAAQVEPLHYLVHGAVAVKIFVVGASDGRANDLAHYSVGALQLAFVLQLELAGHGRHGSVYIAYAGDHQLLAPANGAALGIRDDVLHRADRQPLAHSGALVNALVLTRDERNLLDDLAHKAGDL